MSNDCIFSAIEERLRLPPDRDGSIWHFAGWKRALTYHHHCELEMNLVTQGTATYFLENRRYTLQPGTMVWLFPGQDHILIDRSPDFAMWILVARPTVVGNLCVHETNRPLLENNPTSPFCRRLVLERFERLETLLKEVSAIDSPAEHFNAGLAYSLLSAWNAYTAATASSGQAIHPAVAAVLHRLQEANGVTGLKQITAEFHLSASRLSTLFREQTGVSLSEYRNQTRLERFLHLYGDGKAITATEAALEAGFGSYPQFYRLFRRKMGQSVAKYQR